MDEILIKILIIGETAVGKSCLLLRFAEDKFNQDFLTTIGIDFKVRHMIIDDAKIKLQIWDTAGQEKFRTIAKGYFRGANGIIIVFDVTSRDTFNQCKTWMNSIKETMTEPVDIVLVGNKCDMTRVITEEEAQTLANEMGVKYFETSAKTGQNVENTFMELATMAKRRKDADPSLERSQIKIDIKRTVPKKEESNCC